VPKELQEALGDEALQRAAGRYRTGLAIFWSEEGQRLIVIPPFAISEDKASRGADAPPLRQLLMKESLIGLVLVNWGSYAVGAFQGDNLLASKTGTGHIHKKHKKGGSSQKRFARRTEEQKNEFLKRAARHIEETLRGHRLEHLFFGGNQLILKPLLEENAYLRSYAPQIEARHLPVRYADREALLSSFEHAKESLVFS
jgi:peptide subunit release factor 1 (eRF1)